MSNSRYMKENLKPEEILYTALFVDSPERLLEIFPAKHTKIFAHHSTNWYKPASLEGLEVGKKSGKCMTTRVLHCLLKIQNLRINFLI